MERPNINQKITSLEPDHDDEYFPSLTLGLSLEPSSYYKVDVAEKLQVSSMSVVPSLSKYSNFINSKRDVHTSCCIQQLQVGRVVLDHDEDQSASAGRINKKLRLDRYQSRILEDSFNDHTTLNLKQKQALARHLNLRPRQVEVWYQNRRARNKLKQTEMECEMLKKCNDTLQDENTRLQKEAQQLKLEIKEKGMQLPPANLTICPSCDRITSSVTVSPAILQG